MTAARSIRSLLAALIISLVLVAVSAQPARAAGQLTSAQINAVINLLEAFDVPQATINTVKSVLGGGSGTTNPNVSSASLDQESITTGLGKFYITGTAANTKKVAVVLVPTNYETYASITDYNTIAGQLGKDGIFIEKSDVKNGRWSAQFGINAAATMRVVVFDYASKVALAKGILIIGNSSSNTSEVTFTASPTSGKAPLTVSFKGSGSALSAGAYISFGDGSISGYGEVNATHTYSTPGTYVAALHKDGAKGEMVAFKTVNVLAASLECNRNDNSNTASCSNDQDEDEDEGEEDNSSSEPVYTVPTVVVTYPKNSKGPYDITRDGHFGTSMLIGWRNYKMPAGSYACSFLYNGSSGVSYPLPETNNCVNVGTSNQDSTTRGYARVPAGNKYQAKVVAYKADGTVLSQGLSNAVFSMQVMDRNSQERQVSRDTTSTDSTGKITFGGSATISKIYITMLKDLATVYNSPAIAVTSGRWSHTTTRTFTQGTYSVAILNEAGDVLDSGFVYLNPSKPSDSTGGTSVTQPTLTVATSAGSLWVSIQGSTGQGCDGKTYTLDYGDGVSANIPIGIGSCQPVFTRSYPYKTAGTYTIKVLPPTSCPATAVCASPTPVITKTVTVPGSTSMVPVSELTAALPYLPISFYETMSKVTDALAAVEMAPVYMIVDAFSEFLFQAGLY